MKTHKICKGTNKSTGYGCGKEIPIQVNGLNNRVHGLGRSCGCFFKWMKETPNGQDYAVRMSMSTINRNRNAERKQEQDRLIEKRIEVYGKENRQKLNIEIQKLARMIDKSTGVTTCIDCGVNLQSADGGHFHAKSSNITLSWNLHNVHSQAMGCNRDHIGGGKQLGYYEGLQARYGKEYADYVRFDIVRLYPTIKLSNKEIHEKLVLVRKLIRDFDTFKLVDSRQARENFNNLINIYK